MLHQIKEVNNLVGSQSMRSFVIFVAGCLLLMTSGMFSLAWSANEPSVATGTTSEVETVSDRRGHQKRLPTEISFNAHIRPIMSNTCFACHGPDEEENHSDLRLDSFEAAVGEGEAIKPGNAAGSLVYQRMVDEDDPMPPTSFRHQLSDYEKALFEKWIEQGARYQEHWSYAPIRRPEVPVTAFDQQFVANEIDSFVAARLEFEGLEPSASADKATLLRRLSLDLIGLPPTPEELASFLSDESDQAYQNQVDRLLASPHFGERMASQWLDIVRFGDTVGFHGDQNQRIFPYRDYVINSLNNNKPFDVFTREQLAGDLLKNPTEEQLIATGLIRLNMMTREGGAQPGEYLVKYTADRVRMLGTAWLGSTTGCCECHNHKYDPFTIKDFYALGAFFDDIRQWGVYSTYGYTPNKDLQGFTNDYPFPPELRFRSESLMDQLSWLESASDSLIAKKVQPEVMQSESFREWFDDVAKTLGNHGDGWTPISVQEVGSSKETTAKILGDESVLLTGKPKEGDIVTISGTIPDRAPFKAVRVEVLPHKVNDDRVGRSKDGRFQASVEIQVQAPIKRNLDPIDVRPRFVRIELDNGQPLSLAEVQVFSKRAGKEKNIATEGKATQSTTGFDGDAARAIDGNTDGDYHRSNSVTHTKLGGSHWWQADLGGEHRLTKIVIWNRTDNGYGNRLKNYKVILLNADHEPVWQTEPENPKPSVAVNVPATATPHQSARKVATEFALADRFKPARYRSGQPSRFLEAVWRSGPIAWQLPKDETKLAHTATFHLRNFTEVPDQGRLIFKISSKDVGRVRISVSPWTRYVAGLPAANQTLRSAVLAHADGSSLTDDQRNALLAAWYLASTPADKLPNDVQIYRNQIAETRSGMAMTLIAQQAEPDKRAHQSRVLPRGNWQDTSMPPIEPATPSFLPSLPEAGERRLTRLDLANWITSDENPLTARHYVNRLWKHFFGAGLSNQLDDLGNQGEWPSHPQLLDWMASEFRDTWDIKRMVRLIVMSNTYRQKAAVRSDLSEIDPYNRLLSQQSARRLEAEAVRDNALAIAGLLFKDYIGGPSVFPYQPDGHYSNIQFPDRSYEASVNAFQYRRGVYQHWQRTFLHPMLVNFDAPSRDECTADRTESNSPQQALTLLNDPQFVEASNAFANRLLTELPNKDFNSRLNAAFQWAVARDASDLEQASLRKFFGKQLAYYKDNKEEVNKLLFKNGNFVPSTDQDLPLLSAWSQVCRVIINLHETITRL